ncbi:MAG: hypothetical protein SVU32_04590 [Candidatus Nanohaloarchaea archaeon]|nr:hypothetical protein [Candidatus Nanohaloarchaea archaeon]
MARDEETADSQEQPEEEQDVQDPDEVIDEEPDEEEMIENADEASTETTLDEIVPRYVEDVWDKQDKMDIVLEDGLEKDKMNGFDYPIISVDRDIDLEDVAEKVNESFKDIVYEDQHPVRAVWENEKDKLKRISAGVGIAGLGFASPLIGLGEMLGLGGTMLYYAEVGIIPLGGVLAYRPTKELIDEYKPKNLDDGSYTTESSLRKWKEARENIYLVNADHKDLDTGELGNLVEDEPGYLEEFGLTEEEFTDMTTISEDELDADETYIKVIYDPTDSNEYLDLKTEEAFNEKDISNFQEAVDEGLGYSMDTDFVDEDENALP